MRELESRKLEGSEGWRHRAIVSGLQAVTNRFVTSGISAAKLFKTPQNAQNAR